MKIKIGILILLGRVLMAPMLPSAEAMIVINEILADPSTIEGDANGDGIISYFQDEFVELYNHGSDSLNLSGWTLTDGFKTRHIFPTSSILFSYDFLVVFGGGSPNLQGIHWQTASTGSLGLNNEGDVISLFDTSDLLVNQVVYGSLGERDQSLVRFPEGSGEEFVLHTSLSQAQGKIFSPGTTVDGKPLNSITTPEPPGWVYFALGLMIVLIKQSNGTLKISS